ERTYPLGVAISTRDYPHLGIKRGPAQTVSNLVNDAVGVEIAVRGGDRAAPDADGVRVLHEELGRLVVDQEAQLERGPRGARRAGEQVPGRVALRGVHHG